MLDMRKKPFKIQSHLLHRLVIEYEEFSKLPSGPNVL